MQKNEVLAVVGNRQITQGDVEILLRSLNPQTAAQFQSEEGKKTLVRELVSQELFYLDAVDSGFEKEEECLLELEKAKANILKQYALHKLLDNIVVSESEIVEFYTTNNAYFSAPSSIKASHILVDTREKAGEIADEIRNGLSFEDAAKEYSSCPSKENGGDLGYFSQGMMVPEFEKAAFGMEKEEMSEPVQTQFGYHLIKVYDKKAAGAKSIDEAREQISQQLLSQKQQQAYQNKVNELAGKYPVKYSI